MTKEERGAVPDNKSGVWFRLAHNRAVELGVITAVGVAAVVEIMRHAEHWADRKVAEEQQFENFRKLIEDMERDEASEERRTMAFGLANPEGVGAHMIKERLYPENPKLQRVGSTLRFLTGAGAMERVDLEDTRSDMVRPTTAFIQAVTAYPERCPRLVAETYVFNPDFDLAALRASLPEELRPETLPSNYLPESE